MINSSKRVVSILMMVLMLVGTCVSYFSVFAAEETVYNIDFENETVGEAVANAPVTAKNVDSNNKVDIASDPKNPDNKVLNISKTNSKKKPYALIKLPEQSGAFTVEYRIMFNSDGQCAAVLQSGTANTAQGAYVVSRAASSDTAAAALENCTGSSTWNTLITQGEYKRDEWYNVKIDVDIAAYNYDVTVTDASGATVTATDSSLRHADITVLDYLNVQFAGNDVGNIYVDDIKVTVATDDTEEPEENKNFAADFEDETADAAPANKAISISGATEANPVIVTADPKKPNNKVLMLSRTNTKSKPTALINFPTQTEEFTVSYRIMFVGDAQYGAILQSGTESSGQGVYLLVRDKSYKTNPGEFLHNNGTAWNTLFTEPEFNNETGCWYTVKLNVNAYANTYDITVTDESGVTKTVEGAKLKNSGVYNFDYLNFQFAGSNPGTIYVDDIKVGTNIEEDVPTIPEKCEHTYDNACDTDCNLCGEKRETSHNYSAVVTAPTCTAEGFTTYTCACGDSYKDNYTEATGHAYDNEYDADCNVCGEVRDVEIPVTVVAEGICGVSTTWVLSSDGVLTISGNGDTEDYLVSITTEQPYRAYEDKITKVVFEEGVTSIGRGAFYGFTAITEVVLPESLIAIHEYAFFGCTGITSISIPENTFYIGMYAFRKSGLKEITFANAEGWTFANGTALDVTNVKAFTTENTYKQTCMRPVTENGTVIANGVFGNKDQFTWTLTSTGVLTVSGKGNMPKFNVNTTPWYGYRGAIRSVIIEEGITSVGRCSFHTCRAITNITLPESLETIAEYAFYNCPNVKSVEIPANVTTIEVFAFRKCKQLTDVTFDISYGWSAGGEKLSATEIIKSGAALVTTICYNEVWTRDVNAEEEVLDPNYVAGGACNSYTKWTLTYIDEARTQMKLTVSGNGIMPSYGTAGAPWYGYLDNIVEIEVQEGVTNIGRCAFYGLKFVKTATIADTVTTINDYAFNGCFSLKSIEIPESVTFIADTAFTKTGLAVIPTV